VGGFVGYHSSGAYTSNYWLKTAGHNPALNDIGSSGNVANITNEDATQMKQQATFVGWDFSTTASIEEGASYPYLQYQVWDWDGGGDGVSWTDPLNWDRDMGYPDTSDDKARINTGSAAITMPSGSALTIGSLELGSNFTGSLTAASNLEFDNSVCMSGGLNIASGGVLDLSGKNLSLDGAFSNNGTLRLSGAETLSGFTNDADSGTVEYTGSSAYSGLIGGSNYKHLIFSGSGSFSLGADLSVGGNLGITGSGILDLSGKNLNLSGGFTNSGTLRLIGSETLTGFVNDADSGTVEYAGSGNYGSLNAGNNYCNLAISGNGVFTIDSSVRVRGSLTQSSAGLLQWTNPVLTVGGVIGSRNKPMVMSVTGTAALSAQGMLDKVSIAVNLGSGQYSIEGNIPGFVFINGRVLPQQGQSQIRAALNTGESNLYKNNPPLLIVDRINAAQIPQLRTIEMRLPPVIEYQVLPEPTAAGEGTIKITPVEIVR
jgi:hypothetical protein